MMSVRKNIFETNSSSTHCLVIEKDKLNTTYNEELFNKSYDIKDLLLNSPAPRPLDHMDGEQFQTIEEKLAYCCKLICMQNIDLRVEEDTVVADFLELLREIFPNTDFSYLETAPFKYFYEDGDYVLDEPFYFHNWEEDAEIFPFLDKGLLKHLFQDGMIYFGNRDDENFYNFIENKLEKDDSVIGTSISG